MNSMIIILRQTEPSVETFVYIPHYCEMLFLSWGTLKIYFKIDQYPLTTFSKCKTVHSIINAEYCH